jgi:POT family proton-dependent oligopeptide transporter
MSAERHPKGLYVLFFTEMWERFGFYSMLAMFTLYLKDPVRGFSWTAEEATSLYANYLMFVYASPLIGGWIADKKLGYRNCVLIGGVIFMIGYFLFAIRSIEAVYAALVCLVVGNGFFKPNVSAMVGHLYPEGSTLKDRAYNIFYMGINIGALMAPINAEIWVNVIGFNLAFAIAGLGMILSVAILWCFKDHVEGHGTMPIVIPAGAGSLYRANPSEAVKEPPGVTGEAAATVAPQSPAPAPLKVNPIDNVPDSTRITALIVIFGIVIVFWMVFHQNGSTVTYWADDNTAWKVSGIISNAINPFWVVVLTFPVVWFWRWLDSKGMEPSTPTKMMIGMCLTAASFAILYFAARAGENADVNPSMYSTGDFRINDRALSNLEAEGVPETVLTKLQEKEGKTFIIKGKKFVSDKKSSGEQKFVEALQSVLTPSEVSHHRAVLLKRAYLFKVSPFWLFLAVAVVTLGELMLSPMGLSLVSKVAPVRLRGLMMGGWFVATAIGNKLTAIGVFWDIWLQSTFFLVLSGMALGMGIVLLFLLRPLKKAMPGV